MGIIDWLWPRRTGAEKPRESQHIHAMIERLLVLSPSLRLARHYRTRLAPALGTSFDYVRGLVQQMPAAHEASAATWMTNPYIHAFFAAPDDVPHALSRSPELHAWFDRHPLARETYAVLAMAMMERHVLGVEQHGDMVHADVVRTTLSFDDHQVRVCGETEADLREHIVKRVVEQIALEGLAQIGADESRRDALEEERALLRTRLQLLTRQGAGTGEMLGERRLENLTELAHLQAEIDANERKLAALGLKTDALEHELDVICDVLAHPQTYTHVETKRVRLDPMNVVVEGDGDPRVHAEIEFPLARIPASPLGERAFTLVRFARADLLPMPNLLDEGARFVI
ncbi:hypothetical protein [Paraburkholderia caballeronis]|uniref:Uncharacterized protein n=2 Tax=Paraburkholderia caballeronis TaxID=416943 RepID=A0A1H7VUW9_9BURK|nr:hypothetical protein [Paraburkholderia caballeronis]PXW15450.1 hypothetical protein C7403_12513 [Paraburkholderia caballeronis]PXW93735.1 hypothetical protein C7407_12513 [Paraburkholderia caballeronis]RAJ88975.1 hypothetical protein C7409_12513 [Paraburkholderia caballeronis]TDV05119.1 hypothetical protein C7408_12751 [Paraburkholderia caballeronis]TDV08186.1 hypothetical protein C7406_13013 [Paraburkholderia caballeronis]